MSESSYNSSKSEPEVLMRLVKEHASNSEGVQQVTRELISIAVG